VTVGQSGQSRRLRLHCSRLGGDRFADLGLDVIELSPLVSQIRRQPQRRATAKEKQPPDGT
jgi:hypothetical protein